MGEFFICAHEQQQNLSSLERVLKIILAICTPCFAGDLCQIQVT